MEQRIIRQWVPEPWKRKVDVFAAEHGISVIEAYRILNQRIPSLNSFIPVKPDKKRNRGELIEISI